MLRAWLLERRTKNEERIGVLYVVLGSQWNAPFAPVRHRQLSLIRHRFFRWEIPEGSQLLANGNHGGPVHSQRGNRRAAHGRLAVQAL